jgi:predicted RNA binding protein YcfA (HicA-like mRNA interferase family)
MSSRKRKDIVSHLIQQGWRSIGFTGSHENFVHASRAGKIQVNKTKSGWLKRKTAASIYKQAA